MCGLDLRVARPHRRCTQQSRRTILIRETSQPWTVSPRCYRRFPYAQFSWQHDSGDVRSRWPDVLATARWRRFFLLIEGFSRRIRGPPHRKQRLPGSKILQPRPVTATRKRESYTGWCVRDPLTQVHRANACVLRAESCATHRGLSCLVRQCLWLL